MKNFHIPFDPDEFAREQAELFEKEVNRVIALAREDRCKVTRKPLYFFETRDKLVASIKSIASHFTDKVFAESLVADDRIKAKSETDLKKLFYFLWRVKHKESPLYS